MILSKNLSGHAFIVPEEAAWYDLHSCKVVNQIPEGYVAVKGKNVVGLPTEVDHYHQVNQSLPSQSSLPSLAIHSFCPGRSQATITHIVDGDTVDAAVFIPFSSLKAVVGEPGQGGFFVSVRCRLAGIDAAEHNTAKGKVAIAYLTKLLMVVNHQVEVEFGRPDKYGRALATLYAGEVNVNTALLAYDDPVVGKVANPYDGKTKLSFD